jgi:hypothetical protein
VFPSAARLFEQMTKSEAFDEFLTLPAYELWLIHSQARGACMSLPKALLSAENDRNWAESPRWRGIRRRTRH